MDKNEFIKELRQLLDKFTPEELVKNKEIIRQLTMVAVDLHINYAEEIIKIMNKQKKQQIDEIFNKFL